MQETTNPTINPITYPEKAAHEVVLELIRAGKLGYVSDAKQAFTQLVDHYYAEKKRLFEANKAQ
ncbi:Uncharacterised protein [Klebsiella pneumoniae]|nr:Uncharacterised protein [Klebsiella pneumoniae]